jgi:hypothetical protein
MKDASKINPRFFAPVKITSKIWSLGNFEVSSAFDLAVTYLHR